MGLSWFLGARNGERLVVHPGSDDGFRTYLALAPDRHIGVVIMANSDEVGFVTFQEIMDAVLNRTASGK